MTEVEYSESFTYMRTSNMSNSAGLSNVTSGGWVYAEEWVSYAELEWRASCQWNDSQRSTWYASSLAWKGEQTRPERWRGHEYKHRRGWKASSIGEREAPQMSSEWEVQPMSSEWGVPPTATASGCSSSSS